MNTPEGAVFQPAALAKHSNSGGAVKDFFFPSCAVSLPLLRED